MKSTYELALIKEATRKREGHKHAKTLKTL